MTPLLLYSPPYERSVEDEFAWNMVQYLLPVASLAYQVKTATPEGASLYCDFVATVGNVRYAFEISDVEALGADEKEQRRDARLCAWGGFDRLYRLRGADLYHRVHDCLLILSRLEPGLFARPAHLERRASPEARAFTPLPDATVYQIDYPPASEDGAWPTPASPSLVLRRYAAEAPA